MQIEHEFPLDYVFFGPHAFGVLDDSLAGSVVGIDKVCNVAASTFDADGFTFEVCTAGTVLGRNEYVWHLLAEIRNYPGALPQLELVGAVVLLL